MRVVLPPEGVTLPSKRVRVRVNRGKTPNAAVAIVKFRTVLPLRDLAVRFIHVWLE